VHWDASAIVLSGGVLESEREGASEMVAPESEPAPAASDEPAGDEPETTVSVEPVVTEAPDPVPDAEPELPPVDAASDC
jgi:hypothetical protein